jgi:2-oxoglutarate ferredoxin oxidoreductase subunit alpha
MRVFINGAQAIVQGAIDAGCNFFAGYPITPATEILLRMADELPKVGGIVMQGEDEIASIGFCIGAAVAGRRVMTATSGPGISLYSENIGLAIMAEVPLVIVDVQRMGPATGGATTVSQGDVQFLRWGTSGGYPVIVLAPTNVAECYNFTRQAFDLAERFRSPVFLATDKDTALAMATVGIEEFEEIPLRQRDLTPDGADFTPYRFSPPANIQALSHLGGAHILRFTGSSHDESGLLTKKPLEVGRLNQHLAAKIEACVDEISHVDADLQPGAETLILSYGITARAAEGAVCQVRQAGKLISGLKVYSLWPVPEREILQAVRAVKRIIVPELNLGQYRREIERLVKSGQEVIGVNRVDGELISPAEIIAAGGLQ